MEGKEAYLQVDLKEREGMMGMEGMGFGCGGDELIGVPGRCTRGTSGG